jgi:ferredoxin--NADP+ reductase
LPLEALREFHADAVLFTVGAQGTRKLGLPGEESGRVYAAKDFVYHFNQLPPYATQPFPLGKRVAIVGMGNVMVDVARWILQDDPHKHTDEVVVVARRGPFEVKFDRHEFDAIHMHLDHAVFDQELHRVQERLVAVGQDCAKVQETTFPWLATPLLSVPPKLTFRFLSTPVEILPGADGKMAGLRVAENTLVPRDKDVAAKATSTTVDLDCDTLIYAIGDVVDPALGLPLGKDAYATHPEHPYAACDPKSGEILPGWFVAGWARKPSEGLVGNARMDGEHCVAEVLKYLEAAPVVASTAPADLRAVLRARGIQVITQVELTKLEAAEARTGEHFRFCDNASMLAAIAEG